MPRTWKDNHAFFLIVIGLLAWVVPGGGHFALNQRRRAIVIFVTEVLTFLVGCTPARSELIDPVNAKPWYVAQLINSPAVFFLDKSALHGSSLTSDGPRDRPDLHEHRRTAQSAVHRERVYTAHLEGLKGARA
jgi:hypothetical protein